MFQLFKKRNTGDLISDTINFFKIHGKHYFKSYFAINGILLVLLVIMMYFFSKVYMEFIFSLVNARQSNTSPETILSSYFNQNLPLFFSVIGFMFIITIVSTMVNFAYPVLYLDLFNRNRGENFTTKDIIDELKSNTGKLLKFTIGGVFIIMPIMVIVFAINIALCFILIGIPLLFIVLPAVLCWVGLSFYAYLTEDVRFFESLGEGYRLLKQNFWPSIGASLIITIMIQILQGVITMIPYMSMMGSMYTTLDNPDPNQATEIISTVTLTMAIVMVLSVIVSYVFNNFQFINQGLIYYSLREANEENNTHSEIDLIGNDVE